jgi:hypothetical protein
MEQRLAGRPQLHTEQNHLAICGQVAALTLKAQNAGYNVARSLQQRSNA